MNTFLRKSLAIAGLVTASALYSVAASAQCNLAIPKASMQSESWRDGSQVQLMNVDWHDDDEDIIGMWNVVLTSRGSTGVPDGTVIDRGLQQWHPGGNEFLNSSGQHPLTQNFCLGTWKRTGGSTYSLNHFAYNYDTSQHVIGLTRIQEVVRVDRDGDHFSGTFRIRGYDNARNVVVELKGTVNGVRITVDTEAQDVR